MTAKLTREDRRRARAVARRLLPRRRVAVWVLETAYERRMPDGTTKVVVVRGHWRHKWAEGGEP